MKKFISVCLFAGVIAGLASQGLATGTNAIQSHHARIDTVVNSATE